MTMTTDAPTLFDAPVHGALARSTDPATSHAARHQLDVRERQSEVLRALRHRGVSSTANEVQETLFGFGIRRERNEVASRLAELADGRRWPDESPLARKVGVRKNHRGRDVATWALTVAGRAAAKDLDS